MDRPRTRRSSGDFHQGSPPLVQIASVRLKWSEPFLLTLSCRFSFQSQESHTFALTYLLLSVQAWQMLSQDMGRPSGRHPGGHCKNGTQSVTASGSRFVKCILLFVVKSDLFLTLETANCYFFSECCLSIFAKSLNWATFPSFLLRALVLGGEEQLSLFCGCFGVAWEGDSQGGQTPFAALPTSESALGADPPSAHWQPSEWRAGGCLPLRCLHDSAAAHPPKVGSFVGGDLPGEAQAQPISTLTNGANDHVLSSSPDSSATREAAESVVLEVAVVPA